MMSSCEEDDDEYNLGNGKNGGPQQEDMDQGTLGRIWHSQSDYLNLRAASAKEHRKAEVKSLHTS